MLRIEFKYQLAFAAAGLTSTDAVFRKCFGEVSEQRKTGVYVTPVELNLPGQKRLALFFKLYSYRQPSWRFWGRASKARCEFFNYGMFDELGIRCARRVACGEERDGIGRLRRAFILTEAIPGATTLSEFFKDAVRLTKPGARLLRRSVLRQLANMTHRAHAAHFFHNDLVWRNVLVTQQKPAEPQVWWIDCPRGRSVTWDGLRRRRRLKDLALLNKVASQLATPAERVMFVREYLGVERLGKPGKALIRDVLAYHRRRWPGDWR